MAASTTSSLERSAKPKGHHDMGVASVARAHLSAILSHHAPDLPLKSAIPRIAAKLGMNVRRVRALWNREARAILHDDMAALEACLKFPQ